MRNNQPTQRNATPASDLARDPRWKAHRAMTSPVTIPNTMGAAATEAADANAAKNTARVGPARSTGNVTLSYNRTSQASEQALHARPAKAQLAALIAGEELAHDLLAIGLPPALAAQAEVIVSTIAPIVDSYTRRGMEHRGPAFAEAAARTFLYTGQPAALTHITLNRLRAHLIDHLNDHAREDTDGNLAWNLDSRVLAAAQRLYSRPRLVWGVPDAQGSGRVSLSSTSGLMVDRFHDAHRAGVIERDTWMRGKVAEDITSVAAYLTATTTGPVSIDTVVPRVLGVRVMSHLGPNGAGVHFTAIAHDNHIVVGATTASATAPPARR